jgi:two-component system, sensor histidine kinase
VASIPGQGSTFTLHATFDTPVMQDARIAA